MPRRITILMMAAAVIVAGALLWRAGPFARREGRTRAWPQPAESAGDPGEVSSALLTVEVVSSTTLRPLPGAVVRLTGTAGERRVVVDAGTTSDEGRVALRFGRERDLLASAQAAGHVGAHAAPRAGEATLRLTLSPVGRIEGRVLSPAGEGIAGGVEVTLPGEAFEGLLKMLPEERPADRVLQVRSRPDGLFRLDALPAAAGYRLRAGAPGCSIAERTITLPAGGVAQVEIRLRSTGALCGRLLSRDGAPLGGAAIRLYAAGENGFAQAGAVRTDDEGRFRFVDAGEGRVIVQAEHRAPSRLTFAAATAEVRAAETTDVGDLRPGASRLLVRTALARGAPQPAGDGVRIVVFVAAPKGSSIPFASTSFRSTIGAEVEYVGLPEGRQEIRVVPEGGLLETEATETQGEEVTVLLGVPPPPAGVVIHLPPSQARRAVLLLGRDRELLGRYADLDGRTTPVRFSSVPGGVRGEVWVLEAGRYASVAFDSGTPVQMADAEFRPGFTLGGRVGGSGAPSEVCLAFAGNVREAILGMKPDGEGFFRFPALPPNTLLDLFVESGGRAGPARLVKTGEAGGADETLLLERP